MIQQIRRIRSYGAHYLAVLTAAIFILSACASTPEPAFLNVEGTITASNVLNPDRKGGYRPVNIKIYYLKSAEGFAEASFTDLYKYPDKALGDNILDLKSQQVLPGQNIILSEQIPLGLKYIGVIAAYRDLDDANWKDIKPVPEKCFTCFGTGLWEPVKIRLERLAITLDTGATVASPNSDDGDSNNNAGSLETAEKVIDISDKVKGLSGN